jgi:endogenous inhibitor of DNA gyrase (YacG/DUF329 family)
MKPYITRQCLNCNKEFPYTNGNPYKKYCDNKCQNAYQNKHGLRAKPIPYTKKILEKLYLKRKLSVVKIGKELNVSSVQIFRWLKRYNIPTRPAFYKGMQIRLGAILSAETRRKISEKHKALWENIPRLSPKERYFRYSVEFRLWRDAVLKRDNYTCKRCGLKKGKKQGMEVHHIKSFAKYPELRTSIRNGKTLCRDCHMITDNYGGKTRSKK